jgi:hypothetical protein
VEKAVNTENADKYNPFVHIYPILIEAEYGFVEISLAFAIVKSEGEFSPDKIGTAIPLEPDDRIDLPIETKKRFEIPDDFFSGKAITTNGSFWILPAIVSARKLIGPPQENIPGGEGGEPISSEELGELMENIGALEIFTELRECIVESRFVPQRLVSIIDRFIEKCRN